MMSKVERINNLFKDIGDFDKKVNSFGSYLSNSNSLQDYLKLRKDGLVDEYLEVLKHSQVSIDDYYTLRGWLAINEIGVTKYPDRVKEGKLIGKKRM